VRLKSYFKEAFNELFYKVSWPSWAELQDSSIVVMVASGIIALLVFVMDFSFQWIMQAIYGML